MEEDRYEGTCYRAANWICIGRTRGRGRMEKVQDWLGTPLPDATQFEMIKDVYQAGLPIYETMKDHAAHASVFYSDDTACRILKEMTADAANDRSGTFTTAIVAEEKGRRMLLYFSGYRHAGENLGVLLQSRPAKSPKPIHMADALSRNFSYDAPTRIANCLSHGRRRFYEIGHAFPGVVDHVLDVLKVVYKNDAECRDNALSEAERLSCHKLKSRPLMRSLRIYLRSLLKRRRVEPNGALGQAINYMLRHWLRLTAFLRIPGAPLDNNCCERAIKRFVLLRKNSLFYKNHFGARVGDVLLSLIHTCAQAGENPFDYLTALQLHQGDVAKNPSHWFPWQFRDRLSAMSESSAVVAPGPSAAA